MSVSIQGNVIVVAGAAGVEEAEALLGLIQAHPDAVVDISGAGAVHTALWQVMMALRPPIAGNPQDAFIGDWILPLLDSASD